MNYWVQIYRDDQLLAEGKGEDKELRKLLYRLKGIDVELRISESKPTDLTNWMPITKYLKQVPHPELVLRRLARHQYNRLKS